MIYKFKFTIKSVITIRKQSVTLIYCYLKGVIIVNSFNALYKAKYLIIIVLNDYKIINIVKSFR